MSMGAWLFVAVVVSVAAVILIAAFVGAI